MDKIMILIWIFNIIAISIISDVRYLKFMAMVGCIMSLLHYV
ncbi:MAG: hypothetical protein ACRCTZ_18320 [Sarcina sp.]